MILYQVYKITNNINQKYYIGIHRGDIFDDNYYGSGVCIKQAIEKYGEDNFTQEIISTVDSLYLAQWIEKCLVGENVVDSEFSYNLTEGGGYPPNWTGKILTEDHKRRISENHSKYWKGKKLSDETKRKMSESRKGFKHSNETKKLLSELHSGKTLSEEHKNNLSKSHLGKTLSDATKRKLSKIHKGRKPWIAGRKHKKETKDLMSRVRMGMGTKLLNQYSLNGEFIKQWQSLKEASETLEILNSCISAAANGRTKTAGGYKWEYIG